MTDPETDTDMEPVKVPAKEPAKGTKTKPPVTHHVEAITHQHYWARADLPGKRFASQADAEKA